MIYELDVTKWICGYDDEESLLDNQLGKGDTKLLNAQGYMCCLGQFAAQKGVPTETLLGKHTPEDVCEVYDKLFCASDEVGNIDNTSLTNTLIPINDNHQTTPIEKIEKIRVELEKHGHGLKVKNAHLLKKWKDN